MWKSLQLFTLIHSVYCNCISSSEECFLDEVQVAVVVDDCRGCGVELLQKDSRRISNAAGDDPSGDVDSVAVEGTLSGTDDHVIVDGVASFHVTALLARLVGSSSLGPVLFIFAIVSFTVFAMIFEMQKSPILVKETSLPWYSWLLVVSLDILVISSIDAYVSSIPVIAKELNCSVTLVACSLLASWLSKGAGGVLMGAVSERWGRRPVLLHGCINVAICALGCATASDVNWLIIFCALQRMEATPDLSLVVVQDVLENRQARMSMNSLRWTVRSVAIVAAPSCGGFLSSWFGWRSLFYVQFVWASLNLVGVIFLMPETKPPQTELTQETAGSLSDIASKFGTMVTSPVPVACIAIFAWVFGAIHCMLATMPTVLEDTFGLGLDLTSLLMSVVPVLGFTFPSVVMTVVSFFVELNPLRVLKVGMLVQLFASFVAFTVGSVPSSSTFLNAFAMVCLIVVVTVLMVGGFGMLIAQLETFFMEQVKDYAGLASGFQQMVQLVVASIASVVAVWLTDGFGYMGMLYSIGAMMCMGQVCFWGILVASAHDQLAKTDFSKKGKGKGDD